MTHQAVVRAAVLGSPISHSRSPQLHAAAYRFLGVDGDYTRIELTADQAPSFLREAAADFTGLSVTMPLKAVMVRHMDTVSDRVANLQVLNTITVDREEGLPARLHGENTDVHGISSALQETGLEDSRRGSLGIIGAGGTAVAALAAAADLGFSSAKLYVRSPERGAAAMTLAHRLGLAAEVQSLSQLPGDLTDSQCDAVVSTLPPRAADGLAAELRDLGGAPPLLDAAYDPWPSALALRWTSAGGAVASGLQMLLHQAVKQVELFTAKTPQPAAELSADDHAAMVRQMRAALTQ